MLMQPRPRLIRQTPAFAVFAILLSVTSAQARQFRSNTLLEPVSAGGTTYTGGRMLAGDFNGDGFEDLMVGHPGVARTRIWFGSPTGPVGPQPVPQFTDVSSFEPGNSWSLLGGYFASAVADINIDAFDDVLALYATVPIPRHDLVVTRSNGVGGFIRTQIVQNVGDTFIAVDIDHDGDDDAVCETDGTLRILKNLNGFYQQSEVHTYPPMPARPIAGRFSNSPGPDILIGDSLFINDGTGRFTPVHRPELTSLLIFDAGDINADGFDDLFLYHGVPTFGPLSIWWARPSPYFLSTATWTLTGFQINAPISTPFSGPYRLQGLGHSFASPTQWVIAQVISVFGLSEFLGCQAAVMSASAGSITFAAPIGVSSGGTSDIAIVDFRGDGTPELLAHTRSYSTGSSVFAGSAIASVPISLSFRSSMHGNVAAGLGISFLDQLLTGTDQRLSSIRSADFDSDGWTDLIVNRPADSWAGAGTNSGTNRQLFFGNHQGEFDFSKPLFFIGSDTPFRIIELHDLDADGHDEVWGVSTQTVTRLTVRPIAEAGPAADPRFWDQSVALAAETSQSFSAPLPTSNYSSGSYRAPTGSRMVFDADGDGIRDLVWFQNYRLYFNSEQPSRIVVQTTDRREIRSTTPVRLAAVAPFDFDADGDSDLIGFERSTAGPTATCECYPTPPSFVSSCLCLPPSRLWVFLNSGTGQFTELATTISVPAFADDQWPLIHVVDVTADARPDLLLISNTTGSIHVYVGTPAGLDPTPIVTATSRGITNPAFADIDRDGDIDIVAAPDYRLAGDATRLLSMRNNGFGTFSTDVSFAPFTPVIPDFPALADFDNDRCPDLAFSQTGGLVTVSTNLTPPACSADFNRSGTVDTPDLIYLLGRFGTTPTPGTPPARADFNASGTVDTADLTFFLGRFGQTCP